MSWFSSSGGFSSSGTGSYPAQSYQPVSMDEAFEGMIVFGITPGGLVLVGAIAFGLYYFKKKIYRWYRSAINFNNEHTESD